MTVRIVVACGSGIATSTVLEQRLNELCSEYKLNVSIKKVSMSGLLDALQNADLVVTTSKFKGELGKTIVLSGTPALTGVGEDEFIHKFVDTVRGLMSENS